MKKIQLFVGAFIMVSCVFAQKAELSKNNFAKTSKKVNKTLPASKSSAIWSDDFSDASTWTLGHASSCDLDWQIGLNLSNSGAYPTDAVASTTAANGYAMLDSDAYGADGSGDIESSWMTTASPINLSSHSSILLNFETNYRQFDTQCFIVTSTNNTDWPDLNVDFDASTNPNVYALWEDFGNNDGVESNPTTVNVNISGSAGGQSQVWVRFHHTGTWGYSWFVDDVSINPLQENDIVLNEAWASTFLNSEYGRTPISQLSDSLALGGEMLNFGSATQTGIELLIEIENSAGATLASNTETVASLEQDSTALLQTAVPVDLAEGVYTLNATLTSDADNANDDYFGNNTYSREFEITENLYSLDGIDVYDEEDLSVTSLGTGNTGTGEGNILFARYVISEETSITGLEVAISSQSNAGGQIFSFLLPESSLINEDGGLNQSADIYSGRIAENDVGVTVTQDNIDNNLVFIPLPETTLAPGVYYACAELFTAGGNEDALQVLDDETLWEPYNASLFFTAQDQKVYTNGTALAIRMALGNYLSYGCPNPDFLEYNPNYSIPDVSLCLNLNVEGCTNSLATNYNEQATIDDGSCISSISCGTNLFISEYVEGWSNNKAIELYNPTNETLDLSNYALSRWSNGGQIPQTTALEGSIAPGESFVVGIDKRNPNGVGFEAPLWDGWSFYTDSVSGLLDSIYTADEDLMGKVDLFICPNFEDGTMYFNGNDAMTLETASGDILDIIGKIGENPGNGWTDASGKIWTKDKTLIRKASVTSGFVYDPTQPYTFDPSLEWDSLPANTFSNLGYHYSDCIDSVETGACVNNNNGICDEFEGTWSIVDWCDDNDGCIEDSTLFGAYLHFEDGIFQFSSTFLDENLDFQYEIEVGTYEIVDNILIISEDDYDYEDDENILLFFSGHNGPQGDDSLIWDPTLEWSCFDCDGMDLSDAITINGEDIEDNYGVCYDTINLVTYVSEITDCIYSDNFQWQTFDNDLSYFEFSYLEGQLNLIPLENDGQIVLEQVETIYGCTNPYNSFYNPEANVEDGTCEEILGCTDPYDTSNFDPSATNDDGSCIYNHYGCMDEFAMNYDSLATVSDYCEYLDINNDELMEAYNTIDNLQNEIFNLQSQLDDMLSNNSNCEIIEEDIPLYLPEGWGMFGYTCTDAIDVSVAFESITENILLVKENGGEVYFPEFNFNSIGDLVYSRGYQINMIEEVTDFSFCPTIIVTETPPQREVGDLAEGGIVFYVDETGQHGLVAAMEDLEGFNEWGCYETELSGADGTSIGTGYNNTMDIVAGCSETPIAASVALAYESEGYSDWYLPSKDELSEMYNTIGNGGPEGNIGGFSSVYYWSSTEYDHGVSWFVAFEDGYSGLDDKFYGFRVRVIRAF